MRIPVATNRRDGGAQASLYELAPTSGYVQVFGRRAMSELSPLCAPKQSSGRKQHGGLIPDGAGLLAIKRRAWIAHVKAVFKEVK